MRHKHADEIIAWANGAQFQRQNRDGEWVDDNYPYWYPDVNYRVKPKTLKYRVALLQFDGCYEIALMIDADTPLDSAFVRWLTHWAQVEV